MWSWYCAKCEAFCNDWQKRNTNKLDGRSCECPVRTLFWEVELYERLGVEDMTETQHRRFLANLALLEIGEI